MSLEAMEIATDIAAQGSLSLVMHASLLVFAHTPSASNFHGPHFLLLDTLYIYLSVTP